MSRFDKGQQREGKVLKLFNTMGRKLEEFTPIKPGFVGFYGCGPTVYNYAHIGNLRAYLFLDTLDRALTFLGYEKKHVMNITDVGHLTGDDDSGEDKMLKTAAERHKSVLEIADFYTKAFLDDIDSLNIKRPDVICKATDHIDDMIALIKRIEANGHTYRAGGNLYFDVSTYPDYGKLAMLDLTKLRAGARVGVDPNKKSPYDFVLWFTKSKFDNHALVWDSPWGAGYPGWHIECSAMSMKYLGEQFDIHTGGVDHIPIHHTNEIAQSEGATGKKWVNYWLHNEFLVVQNEENVNDGEVDKGGEGGGPIKSEKMSKSAGNFLRLQTLVDRGYDPLDYRYFLLTTHYRKQAFFSFRALDGARNGRKSLINKVEKLLEKSRAVGGSIVSINDKSAQEAEIKDYIKDFKDAIENDLSTPMALGSLSKVFKDKTLSPDAALRMIEQMDAVLGLKLLDSAKKELDSASSIKISTIEVKGATDEKRAPGSAGVLTAKEPPSSTEDKAIKELIKARQEAKAKKDWATSDRIRDELKAMGVSLIDTKDGIILKK